MSASRCTPTPRVRDAAATLSERLGYLEREANALYAQGHGFATYDRPVEGSLVNYENLDNAQTGIHDYFKFLKFGFGRATDIACLHVRRDRITREAKLYGDQGCIIHQPGRDSVFFKPVRVTTSLPDAATTPAAGTVRVSMFVNAPRALNDPAC